MKYYLFITESDVDPEIQGPFKDNDERGEAARAHKRKRGDDGIYMLDIDDDGTPSTCPYSSAFFGVYDPTETIPED